MFGFLRFFAIDKRRTMEIEEKLVSILIVHNGEDACIEWGTVRAIERQVLERQKARL